MTIIRTKREDVCHFRNLEDLTVLLRSAITLLPSKETNRATEEEVLRLLESLKIVILARQARLEHSTTIWTPADLLNMKLRNHQFSTQPQIFERYKHPWYEHNERLDKQQLNKPNPPSQESVDKAQFKDKTSHWNRSSDIRPRNKRTTKWRHQNPLRSHPLLRR